MLQAAPASLGYTRGMPCGDPVGPAVSLFPLSGFQCRPHATGKESGGGRGPQALSTGLGGGRGGRGVAARRGEEEGGGEEVEGEEGEEEQREGEEGGRVLDAAAVEILTPGPCQDGPSIFSSIPSPYATTTAPVSHVHPLFGEEEKDGGRGGGEHGRAQHKGLDSSLSPSSQAITRAAAILSTFTWPHPEDNSSTFQEGSSPWSLPHGIPRDAHYSDTLAHAWTSYNDRLPRQAKYSDTLGHPGASYSDRLPNKNSSYSDSTSTPYSDTVPHRLAPSGSFQVLATNQGGRVKGRQGGGRLCRVVSGVPDPQSRGGATGMSVGPTWAWQHHQQQSSSLPARTLDSVGSSFLEAQALAISQGREYRESPLSASRGNPSAERPSMETWALATSQGSENRESPLPTTGGNHSADWPTGTLRVGRGALPPAVPTSLAVYPGTRARTAGCLAVYRGSGLPPVGPSAAYPGARSPSEGRAAVYQSSESSSEDGAKAYRAPSGACPPVGQPAVFPGTRPVLCAQRRLAAYQGSRSLTRGPPLVYQGSSGSPSTEGQQEVPGAEALAGRRLAVYPGTRSLPRGRPPVYQGSECTPGAGPMVYPGSRSLSAAHLSSRGGDSAPQAWDTVTREARDTVTREVRDAMIREWVRSAGQGEGSQGGGQSDRGGSGQVKGRGSRTVGTPVASQQGEVMAPGIPSEGSALGKGKGSVWQSLILGTWCPRRRPQPGTGHATGHMSGSTSGHTSQRTSGSTSGHTRGHERGPSTSSPQSKAPAPVRRSQPWSHSMEGGHPNTAPARVQRTPRRSSGAYSDTEGTCDEAGGAYSDTAEAPRVSGKPCDAPKRSQRRFWLPPRSQSMQGGRAQEGRGVGGGRGEGALREGEMGRGEGKGRREGEKVGKAPGASGKGTSATVDGRRSGCPRPTKVPKCNTMPSSLHPKAGTARRPPLRSRNNSAQSPMHQGPGFQSTAKGTECHTMPTSMQSRVGTPKRSSNSTQSRTKEQSISQDAQMGCVWGGGLGMGSEDSVGVSAEHGSPTSEEDDGDLYPLEYPFEEVGTPGATLGLPNGMPMETGPKRTTERATEMGSSLKRSLSPVSWKLHHLRVEIPSRASETPTTSPKPIAVGPIASAPTKALAVSSTVDR